MGAKIISDSLIIKLKKQGYSDGAVKELYKWYDFSEKKEVVNY